MVVFELLLRGSTEKSLNVFKELLMRTIAYLACLRPDTTPN